MPTATSERCIEWIGPRAIFEPLPPTKWVSEALQLGPGRPALLAGYGSSGKTLAAQAAALAVATGEPIWGHFGCSQGVVRHFDHEQGRQGTLKRYQRLTLGMGIEPVATDGALFVACFPDVRLNMQGAVDVYARECEGTSLVIIDALRGAAPGEDENDSRIRRCLDVLTEVSEKTGAACLVVHHAGKGATSQGGDARLVARGSSAIFDAAGCVLVAQATQGRPIKVTQAKTPAEAEGAGVEPFHLRIEDVADGIRPRAGVRVRYLGAADLATETGPADSYDEHAGRILALVEASPGIGKKQLRAMSGMKAERVDTVTAALLESGQLRNDGDARRWKLHAA